MSLTGVAQWSPWLRQRGFTMLELMVAISVVALLLAVTVPASMRFYESIQYRQAVRDVITTLASARYSAINKGRAQDVLITPRTRTVEFNGTTTRLPEVFTLAVQAAGELNQEETGVIRFYPEGGSSGGGIDLERGDGSGVRISVDWLMGGVMQATYVIN